MDQRAEEIAGQLRAKIASKFQVTIFLSGFAATILAVEMGLLWGGSSPGLAFLSVSFLFGSLIIYVAGILKLDTLTMPKSFWPRLDNFSGEVVQLDYREGNLPQGYIHSRDLWALYERMLFYWRRLTLVATYLVGVSLTSVIVPITVLATTDASRWAAAATTLIVSAISVTYVWVTIRTERFQERWVRLGD